MRLSLLVLSLLAACQNDKVAKKSEGKINREQFKTLLEGHAPQVTEPVANGLFAAKGEDVVERTIQRDRLYSQPTLPPSSVDILSKIGILLVNELPEGTGVTDAMVRAAADVSYTRLGIADESLRGWTLFVRMTGNGMTSTGFNEKKKFIIIEIDPAMFAFSASHEMTHALFGRVTLNNWIPGIMNEFVATAAEIYQPPGADQNPFTYDVLNRPIFGTGKNRDGDEDRIHAMGAPLDGLRYELLRQAGKKIGDEAYRSLAKTIYAKAVEKKGPLTMDDLKPAFDSAGIGDCALFTHTTEPGVYVDLLVGTDHVPLVMTKYIDGNGQESAPQAPFSLSWKKGGRTIGQYQGMTMPIMSDNGAVAFAGSMDQYIVTVGTLTYTYDIR